MAASKQAKKVSSMYIRDMPWPIYEQILTLDEDAGWKKLAAEIGYSVQDIKHFERVAGYNRNGSPTRAFLDTWGELNTTVWQLYELLYRIGLYREMKCLESIIASENKTIFNIQHGATYRPSNGPNNINLNSKTYDKDCFSARIVNRLNPDELPRPKQPVAAGRPINITPCTPAGNSISNSVYKLPNNVNVKTPQENPLYNNLNLQGMNNSIVFPPMAEMTNSIQSGPTHEPEILETTSISMEEISCLYTYKELSLATNGFSQKYLIGEGAFGNVYFGKLKNTECAIKKLSKDFEGVNETMAKAKNNPLNEFKILLKLRHKNITNIYGYSLDEGETCFVYEYMENRSLDDCLEKMKPSLTWAERLNIACGSACGLQYLHTLNNEVIHGDIKSANILIDKHKEAKIGDFGLAVVSSKGKQTGILEQVSRKMNSRLFGTIAYMPPEFCTSNGQLLKETDVYSFGVVLFEILTGEKAYDERREPKKFLIKQMEFILENKQKDDWPKEVDKKAGHCLAIIIIQFFELAFKCIAEKKKDRPSMVDVLQVLEQLQRDEKVFREDAPARLSFENRLSSATSESSNESLDSNNRSPNSSLPYQLQCLYDKRNEQIGEAQAPEESNIGNSELCSRNITPCTSLNSEKSTRSNFFKDYNDMKSEIESTDNSDLETATDDVSY